MKSKLLFLSLIMSSFLVSCSSTKPKPGKVGSEEVHNLQRDYIVRDASSNIRPAWISDAVEWAKVRGDLQRLRYFSFETSPKVDREVACSLAKTNARADIASEIAAFIDKSLGQSKEGAASINENNPQTQELREFIEVTLAEKVKALIHGAAVRKSYWEKRQYKASMGAKKDFVGYTCAALISIDKKYLKKAVEEAANHVVRKADDPETKENVKKALEKVSDDFDKAKQGLL